MNDQDPALGLIERLDRDLRALQADQQHHGNSPQLSAKIVARHREIGAVRAGRTAVQVVDSLAVLCVCNTGPDTDGPDQDCPIHGNVTSFVMLCRWRDAVVAAAHAVNDTVADAPGLIVVQRDAWVRLRDLLNVGPWSGAMTDAAIDGPPADPTVPF